MSYVMMEEANDSLEEANDILKNMKEILLKRTFCKRVVFEYDTSLLYILAYET